MKNSADKKYKVALVGLDLTTMDDNLIRYVAMMSEVLKLERVLFVYVAKDLELPADLLEKYPGLVGPMDESIEADIKSKVDKYFHNADTAVECLVKEGNPIERILKLSKVKHVDLMFMGRKKSLHGSGLISSKIARRCPCSLLLVTETHRRKLKKILVPVDFSKHSSLALQLAINMKDSSGADVQLVNIFKVPGGYHTTGKSFNEFAEIMKGHAQNDCKKFLSKNDFPADLPCEYLLSNNGNFSNLTYDYAERNKADLIIIGSRGRTKASSMLMGSVAEKLVYLDSHVPVLIVKEGGENMGFLDTLMKL